jgi:methenyltetrahydrofolate cyclohydrolase
MPGLEDQPLGALLGFVAAPDPAPGGGTSAAVAAALGTALLEMAASLEAARGEPDAAEIAQRARELRAHAVDLADRDLSSYAPVLEAQRLPEGTPDRAERVAAALGEASQTPLAVAEAAAEVAELGARVCAACHPAVRGDALAGVLIAEAAATAATGLVEVNLARSDGPDLARARDARRRAQEARQDALASLPRGS